MLWRTPWLDHGGPPHISPLPSINTNLSSSLVYLALPSPKTLLSTTQLDEVPGPFRYPGHLAPAIPLDGLIEIIQISHTDIIQISTDILRFIYTFFLIRYFIFVISSKVPTLLNYVQGLLKLILRNSLTPKYHGNAVAAVVFLRAIDPLLLELCCLEDCPF